MTMQAVRTAGLALAAMLLMAAPALAQSKGEGRAALVQKLADCRKLTDDTARLACYDQTAAALDQAEAKGDIVVVDREQAREVRRQAFGLALPSLSIFEKGESTQALERMTGVIASASRDGLGNWMVVLDDGAIWTQTDGAERSRRPTAGMRVEIRKAALGSFLMKVDGQPAVRARRVQ